MGLSSPLTCAHALAGRMLVISEMRLATNVFQGDKSPFIQYKVVKESVYAKISRNSILHACLTCSNKRDKSNALHSSRRGIEIVLIGATRDFEHNNRIVCLSLVKTLT